LYREPLSTKNPLSTHYPSRPAEVGEVQSEVILRVRRAGASITAVCENAIDAGLVRGIHGLR